METKDNYYKLQHINGDFEVTYEFTADGLEELIMMIKGFLKGCTFSEKLVDEYIPED
jgi:hypothetical protein